MTGNLIKAKKELFVILRMIHKIEDEIRFQNRELYEMVSMVAEQEPFTTLSFLKECASLAETSPFPKAWKIAVENWDTYISESDRQRLISLNEILGASDGIGQIQDLELIKAEFEESYRQQQEIILSKGKLYRSLGVLLGVGLLVLLI